MTGTSDGRLGDTQILWIYEVGNNGKTTLAKYQHVTAGVFYYTNAKTADIAFAYNKGLHGYYGVNESDVKYNISLKNGMLFSSK